MPARTLNPITLSSGSSKIRVSSKERKSINDSAMIPLAQKLCMASIRLTRVDSSTRKVARLGYGLSCVGQVTTSSEK